MLHKFEIATHGNEMTSNIEIDNLNQMVTKHKSLFMFFTRCTKENT